MNGKQLQKLRLREGYTQEELANITGYSKNHVSKMERDKAEVSPQMKCIIELLRQVNNLISHLK